MKLRATYWNGDGIRLIGSTSDSQDQFEEVDLCRLIEAIERLHCESGFAQVELTDGYSSVDIADYGDGQKFFIEQYYDTIYGGIYGLRETKQIITAISECLSSEKLRDLFPTLEGELVYDIYPDKIDRVPKASQVQIGIRRTLAPAKPNKDNKRMESNG